MPRYFMQDTPLAGLEREMITVPRYNFKANQPMLPQARISVEVEHRGKKGVAVLSARCGKEAENGI